MEDTIKEKFINKAIEPVSLDSTEKIVYQMKKCVCRININGSNGTGFFVKLPYNKELIKVLITNNHIINKKDIETENTFTIILDNEKEKKLIKINKKKINYTNEQLDVTIIELDDKYKIENYLEIDEDIIKKIKLNKDQIELYYKDFINKSIYIINYLKTNQVMVSYGLITDIREKQIYHICNTDNGSSGSPILSLSNNKLIGIHYGSSKNFDINKGILIIYAIIDFNVMMSEKLTAIEKIKDEIKFIVDYPFTDIGINIELPNNDNDLFEWKGYLIGPDDTNYKDGIFYFEIKFPQNFPKEGPEIIFLTPIYHLNVNPVEQTGCSLGHISISILNWWQSDCRIREILIKFYLATFYLENPESSFGLERREICEQNYYLHQKKIKYFTKLYANPINASKFYNNHWDFSYFNDNNNDIINIVFEYEGKNRLIFQSNKNELAKDLILRFCGTVGINENYIMCFHKSRRLVLDKTIKENDIDNNNSLIIVVNARNLVC